ncbi:MAG: tRNA glutamyl-Q(34) synthetase GluQRS [Burkholderiaceae bacterium]|nr:tRNA glutamyl-Q(34) synthetase GluQRS [Burkholderiaceae bacterium]
MDKEPYVGRFAPSPTGRLHAGSLAAALASYVDARAHGGTWLIRIEDVDIQRCSKESALSILDVLARLEMQSDAPVVWQTERFERYEAVLKELIENGMAYGCSCSRSEIQKANLALGREGMIYPGTCRAGVQGAARAIRFRTHDEPITVHDRWSFPFTQCVESEVGDFVIKRADGNWAYQLAVLVDDHDAGVTDVVRGADLIDNTPRQIQLLNALGWDVPRYMHIPLVLNDRQEKLSKQAGALALSDDLLEETERAWTHLGFERIGADRLSAFYPVAIEQWKEKFRI